MSEAAAPTADALPSAIARQAIAPRAALATLGAALAAAAIVPGSRAGLGLALASVLLLLGAAIGSDLRASRWRVALLIASAQLATVPLFRDAAWLVSVDLLIALLLAAIALGAAGTWSGFARVPWALIPSLFAGPAAVVGAAIDRVPMPPPGALAQLTRAGLLAAALVAVFAALFAWADAAFAELFGSLAPEIDAPELWARIALGAVALCLGGALVLLATAGAGEWSSPEARQRVAPLEWGVALGALAALFAGFVAVQFVVLFGGQDHVLETAGLTYAEYARQGFLQLVAVALLVIGVIAAALRWSRVQDERQRLLLRALLLCLCALTMVVLASALHRLDLYVDAFGATRPRLVAAVSCAWIAGVLLIAAASLFTRTRGWLPPAIAVLTAAVAIGVTVANPDARIAERNVDRYFGSTVIDRAYNAQLSADATPSLARLPKPVSEPILAAQLERLVSPDGVWGLNLARGDARKALRDSGSG